MKTFLLLPFLLMTTILSSQNFIEFPAPPVLEGNEMMAFSDVDGDGDEDVLLAGYGECGPVTKLYTNDGDGNFTKMQNTPFEGVTIGSLAFSDVDSDGDEDVFISGRDNSFLPITKLYTNDGSGDFSEAPGTTFEGVSESSIAFADVDEDGDQDVLISGTDDTYFWSFLPVTKLYLNDGDGNFSENLDALFEAVQGGSIAFLDLEDDGDEDILISGRDSSWALITKLYINDGDGSFMEAMDTGLENEVGGKFAIADVDGDGDEDVLFPFSAKLYINESNLTFSEMTEPPFEPVDYSSIAFADIEGDGDQDVLITGQDSAEIQIAKLYSNNGSGNFTELSGTTFESLVIGSIAFADVDSDGDQDVLTGLNLFGIPFSKIYFNNGIGNFIGATDPTYFRGVVGGAIAFSDVDNDGDEDVLISGAGDFGGPMANLYTNDGSGNFTEVPGTSFNSVQHGSIAYADVDSDGDEDMLITGFYHLSGSGTSTLYINDGSGDFTEIPETAFDSVSQSSIAFADIDNDGDQDVLITGVNNLYIPISKLYTNDGSGTFTEKQGIPFVGVKHGAVAFADVDGDNDQDVLIAGRNIFNIGITQLFRNDGNGNFSEAPDFLSDGVGLGVSLAFADVDSDSDQDLLITGKTNADTLIAKLFTNDGNGNFSLVADTPFENTHHGSIAFTDVDGDGDQDVLITGRNKFEYGISKLYLNDGNGNFDELPGTPFWGGTESSVAFADVNGDDHQDLLITGRGYLDMDYCFSIAKLYVNDGTVSSKSNFIEKSQSAIVYPNPTSNGQVFIDYVSKTESDLHLSLFDLSGKVVRQFEIDVSEGSNKISVDVLNFPKGIYFFKLNNGVYITTLKLLIQ